MTSILDRFPPHVRYRVDRLHCVHCGAESSKALTAWFDPTTGTDITGDMVMWATAHAVCRDSRLA